MATLLIKERFEVPAPPDVVFSWLVDPERVVVCLPGAALEESEDARTHHGTVTVSLGAVTVSYKGTMEFEEVDDEARRVRMKGTGREKSGSGSARMTMTGRVEAAEDGGSSVVVDSEVEVAGKIVRFGRGMIQRVSREIFRDFAACLAERIVEAEGAGREVAERSADADRGGASAGPEEGDADEATGSVEGEARSVGGEARSARALPLLFRAFKGWIRDLLAGFTRRGR